MHFDFADLRLFVSIAEHNSITKGAEISHISLPAASNRIKNLEDSIGEKLLYRTSRGVTLTLAGQAFVHHARLILGQMEHLRAGMQEYVKGIKGHVRIFSNTTALSEFLPLVLREYLSKHPDVNIDLQERLSFDIVRAVSEGHTDIGIVAGSARTENLEVIPYRQDRLVLVVPKNHILAMESSIDFFRTLDFDYVGLQEASAIQTFLRQHAERLQRSLKMRIQVGNFEAVCRMIEATVGVGILPASAALRHAKQMDIAIIHLNDEWALRAQNICIRSLSSLPSFARDLVEMLVMDAKNFESSDQVLAEK